MNIAEIMGKAREFLSEDVKCIYTVIACVNEWQKETGGTLDEILTWMDAHFSKKQTMADFLAEISGKKEVRACWKNGLRRSAS